MKGRRELSNRGGLLVSTTVIGGGDELVGRGEGCCSEMHVAVNSAEAFKGCARDGICVAK